MLWEDPNVAMGVLPSQGELLQVLRRALENAVNHCIERCRTPARYAHTSCRDPVSLLRGYVGDGVASHDVTIDIEDDVPAHPHCLVVERA